MEAGSNFIVRCHSIVKSPSKNCSLDIFLVRFLLQTPTEVLVYNFETAKYCECGQRLREYFKQVSYASPILYNIMCLLQPYSDQCCGSMTFWGGSGSGSADPCL
jgi:hypothetical protein